MTKPKAPTLRQFQDRFPTEESCLEHLMRVRYGDRHDCDKCGKSAHFYRVRERRSYACEHCGHQVYPTAGTPFHRTRTPLRDWFYVMFLFCSTRSGVAAKEVERQLGVTYKTAWRMCHEIRKYMAIGDGDEPLGGPFRTVEIDETFIGGEVQGRGHGYTGNKTLVFGMMQRNGNIITRVVPNRRRGSLLPHVTANVLPYTEVHSDQHTSYTGLEGVNGYWHKSVNHDEKEYARGHVTVNGIEGFWAQLKRSINGTHIHVSGKHLPKYLGEFEYRHNRRDRPETMIGELMTAFRR
ncbi:DDE transposase [Novosphingobium marinum]|uniref:Transposase-like protein/ribosomal protein L37AE/L43A n=1 Tax=Novosphingobium marinum TaxID=1514948 RepID=A0A7Y9XV18_9SPHN|nr:IS1595 family transposase [Novosphingobium marinum]NYH95114.1 transposase-like protein/ribosomal protein L37AE/L43A [Novosphingobium marinum]GGC24414.1 DDE transposase [Novosphingobium marinum]